MHQESIPFNALVRCPPGDILTRADVVIGRETATGRVAVFYGKDTLQHIVQTGAAQNLSVLQVQLNFSERSDEPERLAELCLAHKGRCDFD